MSTGARSAAARRSDRGPAHESISQVGVLARSVPGIGPRVALSARRMASSGSLDGRTARPTTGACFLGQAAAGLGAGCAALHVLAASGPGHGGWPAAVLFAVMAAACVPCLRGLWRGPTRRTWAMTGSMYAAMLGAHALLLAGGPWAAAAAHRAHVHGELLTWTDVAMWAGLGLAGVQVVLAGTVLLAGTMRPGGPGALCPPAPSRGPHHPASHPDEEEAG